MEPYVAKRRTTVRISQAGLEPADGHFCLAIDSAELRRAETLLDLLNSGRRMVPFVRSDDDRVSLLTRIHIDWVVAGPAVPVGLIYPPHFRVGFEESVHVAFLDGRTIEGMLEVEASPVGGRASDFLNTADDFFPVRTRLGTLLANKSRVRETLLIESADSPAAPMPRLGRARDPRAS